MSVRFKMSNRGVGQLLKSPEVKAELLRRATNVKAAAEALSPVGGPGDAHPGKYKGSWKAKVQSKRVGRTNRLRPVGVVLNTAHWARWVEYGSEQYPGRHVLLRAARAAGGDS